MARTQSRHPSSIWALTAVTTSYGIYEVDDLEEWISTHNCIIHHPVEDGDLDHDSETRLNLMTEIMDFIHQQRASSCIGSYFGGWGDDYRGSRQFWRHHCWYFAVPEDLQYANTLPYPIQVQWCWNPHPWDADEAAYHLDVYVFVGRKLVYLLITLPLSGMCHLQ